MYARNVSSEALRNTLYGMMLPVGMNSKTALATTKMSTFLYVCMQVYQYAWTYVHMHIHIPSLNALVHIVAHIHK